MKEKVEDEQSRMFLCNKLEIAKDLMDNGFESFMRKEGLSAILNLILEKQVHNLMFKEKLKKRI
jgi:hypothetical protein